jgi:hypothetical protein
MSAYLLDLCDSNILLGNEENSVEQAGIAVWTGQEYRFGSAAWPLQKANPGLTLSRFWMQPSVEPLSPQIGDARHYADLIHAHLSQLSRGDEKTVLVSVPGHYSDEQLSLLLGILQATPLQAHRLLHRSAIQAAFNGEGKRMLHIEMHLQQLLISEMHEVDGERTVKRSTSIAGQGILPLRDRILHQVNKSFIEQTRYDALRSGKDEQLLSDQLTTAHLSSGDELIEFKCGSHVATLSFAQLKHAFQPLIDAVARFNPEDAHCLIEDHGYGCQRFFPKHWRSTTVSQSSIISNLDQLTALSQDYDAYTLIDKFPNQSQGHAAAQSEAAPSEARGLKLMGLRNHRAVDLVKWLALNAPNSSLHGHELRLSTSAPELITVNGRLVTQRQTLRAGDKLNINGAIMTVIELEE